MENTINFEYNDWFFTPFNYICIKCQNTFTSTQQEFSNNKEKLCYECLNPKKANIHAISWKKLFWKSLGY